MRCWKHIHVTNVQFHQELLHIQSNWFALAMTPSSNALSCSHVTGWFDIYIKELLSCFGVSEKWPVTVCKPLEKSHQFVCWKHRCGSTWKIHFMLLSWYVQHTNPALSLYWFQAVNCVVSPVSRVKNPRVLPSLTCSQDACGANARRLGRWRTQCCPRWTRRTTVASAMPPVAAQSWM